jgi:outer membrane immunogenic protein
MRQLTFALAAGTALTVGLSQGVSAADMAVKAPVAKAAPFSWTGIYFGLSGGYARGSGDHSYSVDGLGFLDPLDADVRIRGWLAGAQIGYNWQVGSVVYGIEADFSWADINGMTIQSFDDGFETEVKWFGTVRGRVGTTISNLLLYVTGGLAYGKINATVGDIDFLPGPVFDPITGLATDSATKFGWTAGAGAEIALGSNWSAKLEWLYVDLGNLDFNGIATNFPGLPVVGEVDANFHLVRGGVNFRF